MPEAGSQPSQSEKHTIRTRPSQKLGMLAPKIEPTVLSRSTSEFGREAESTPSVTPPTVESSSAVAVSSRVARKRISTSPSTGCRIRMERPRSPWSTWPIQRTYCIGSGSSRPSAARRRATSSWVACEPSMISAGSPGERCRTRKTTTDTPSSTGTSRSRRRRR